MTKTDELNEEIAVNKFVKRQQDIIAGKLYQVYDRTAPDEILFEGSRTKCIEWAKRNVPVQYKYGTVRLGKLIYENLPKKNILD